MMMGVAQVMGMNPTLRSFFSGAPAWAKASMAVPSGKNCEIAASAVEAPTARRKARAALILGEQGAHHRGFDDARQARIR